MTFDRGLVVPFSGGQRSFSIELAAPFAVPLVCAFNGQIVGAVPVSRLRVACLLPAVTQPAADPVRLNLTVIVLVRNRFEALRAFVIGTSPASAPRGLSESCWLVVLAQSRRTCAVVATLAAQHARLPSSVSAPTAQRFVVARVPLAQPELMLRQ